MYQAVRLALAVLVTAFNPHSRYWNYDFTGGNRGENEGTGIRG